MGVWCFVDGWFDLDDEERETAEMYHACDTPDGGQQVDACMLGKQPANPPTRIKPLKPLRWFNQALRIHLLHVVNEWRKTILALENSMSKYEEEHRPSMSQRHGIEDDEIALRWAEGINGMAEKLSRTLSQLVNEGQRFRNSDCSALFQNLPDTCIHTIDRQFEDFTRLLERLKGIVARSEKYVAELGNYSNNRQGQVARKNKDLAVILMLSNSLVLTAAIFAIDKDVRKEILPFIPATLPSFIVMWLVFVVGLVGFATIWGVIDLSLNDAWLKRMEIWLCLLPVSISTKFMSMRFSLPSRQQRTIALSHVMAHGRMLCNELKRWCSKQPNTGLNIPTTPRSAEPVVESVTNLDHL